MWGIFYIILSVPQITLMDMNNVRASPPLASKWAPTVVTVSQCRVERPPGTRQRWKQPGSRQPQALCRYLAVSQCSRQRGDSAPAPFPGNLFVPISASSQPSSSHLISLVDSEFAPKKLLAVTITSWENCVQLFPLLKASHLHFLALLLTLKMCL